ncbi:MAG: pentapeptide repeat-containing protein [Acidimicrobiales bacterium]
MLIDMLQSASVNTATLESEIVPIVSALVGLLGYVQYRSRRDRKAAVGKAFTDIVSGLGSVDQVQRLTSAILLRRFFDPAAEFSTAGMPYAPEALSVITAVLRTEPTGNLQKLLADGLSHAPSLTRADLQNANLRGAYLGGVNATRADFYRADLSHASLKASTLLEGQFYQTQMVGTVLESADLRRANFFEAELSNARFHNALLAGARFTKALNVPPSVAAHLNDDGVFEGPEGERLVDPGPIAGAVERRIFLSAPSLVPSYQNALLALVTSTLAEEGLVVERLRRDAYVAAAPLRGITAVLKRCHGAVILGLPQMDIGHGQWKAGTSVEVTLTKVKLATPWNHIEAGCCAAFGLPLLLINDGTMGGVFELLTDGEDIVNFDLGQPWDLDGLQTAVHLWALKLKQP